MLLFEVASPGSPGVLLLRWVGSGVALGDWALGEAWLDMLRRCADGAVAVAGVGAVAVGGGAGADTEARPAGWACAAIGGICWEGIEDRPAVREGPEDLPVGCEAPAEREACCEGPKDVLGTWARCAGREDMLPRLRCWPQVLLGIWEPLTDPVAC